MDHETRFACEEQAKTLRDAELFVKYMASPDLFDMLDMSSISPLEGRGNESNLRMHTTRLITDHMNEMANKALGVDLYTSDTVSSLYQRNETSSMEVEKGEGIYTFGSEFKAHHEEDEQIKQNLMKYLAPSEPITDQDTRREIITIKHENKALTMKILIENYVFATYLCNKNEPRKRCKINLLDMAAKCLMFGVQYSKNKFSKNDLRNRWGSHLIFESGVLIETGTTDPLLAAKLLEHTMNIFKYVCGYHNIGIWERRCQNVVATGSLDDGVCLELLKVRFPFVKYEKKNFAGAIICIKDIDGTMTAYEESNSITVDEFTNYEKNYVNVADKYNRKYNNIGSEAEQKERDQIQSFLASNNATIGASYEVTYDEFDMLHVLRGNKDTNVKALIFPRGRVICVGNKSREGVIASYAKLFPILESCRCTPENMRAEKNIIQKRRANYSKKRKREAIEKNEKASKKAKTTTVMVQCRHCDYTEPFTNFATNKAVCSSENATHCDECDHSVCNACLELLSYKRHTNDYNFLCNACQ